MNIATPHRQGFTLIEVMLAVVIASILAALTLPSYQRMVQKGRRADAIAALTTVQQAQERWRTNQASYADTLDSLGIRSAESPAGYYQIRLSEVSHSGYTITATPVERRVQAQDRSCAAITVVAERGQVQYGGSNAAGTPTTECWAR
ncbi:prepilin-type N-terminal cleavage/methylation domain-containing protein [Roseateles sp. DAIF2]|uniref:type IV pilin protein n=1 Tax=Roseateles sp. DAIF2 TaxID=2714952 RepID=UPI0018A281B2|nr:type IV pilin protein [Roseateles sp. DAIF2]QPF73848.1 prepilin-type N-terminal cleavage/methylation domain-containing protein [Roseateles sp. DAIF2]